MLSSLSSFGFDLCVTHLDFSDICLLLIFALNSFNVALFVCSLNRIYLNSSHSCFFDFLQDTFLLCFKKTDSILDLNFIIFETFESFLDIYLFLLIFCRLMIADRVTARMFVWAIMLQAIILTALICIGELLVSWVEEDASRGTWWTQFFIAAWASARRIQQRIS